MACIGISIGSSNAYVAINGEAVANADGFRNTKAMVTEDGEVGQAAIGRWVRQPDSLLDRSSPKYWKLLLEDLFETVKSNAGGDLDSALVNIVIPASDDRVLVSKVASEIFKKVQVIDNQAKVLVSSSAIQNTTESSQICALKIGGNRCQINLLGAHPETKLFSIISSNVLQVGGNQCIEKLVEHCALDFKRKNRACQEGVNARGKRKLFRAATSAMQTLTQSLQANLHVDSIWEGVDLNMNVSRGRFEDMARPVWQQVMDSLPPAEEIAKLYVYGGSSNMPLLQNLLKQKYPEKCCMLDAELTLAKLASEMEEKFLSGDDKATLECKTLPYTVTLGSEHVLIKKGSILPTALHGNFQLKDGEQNLPIQVAGHGDLTEPLLFEKSDGETKKTAKNPKGLENLVNYYLSHDGVQLKVHLEASRNNYQFVF